MSQEPVNGLIPTPPQKEAWENWGDGYSGKKVSSRLEVWNSSTLQWERMTQPGAAGGGGGGPATIADGADVAEGATTDAAVVTDANGTVSGKLRGLVKWAFERMPASLGQKTMAASLPVVVSNDQSAVPVSGTFFQGTQPVSLAAAVALDAPTLAALETIQVGSLPAVALDAASLAALETISVANFPGTQPVSGTVTADTELEAAAALADASGNPTTARVGAGNLVWNGTGWDRARGDITNGIDVDVTRVQGNVAVTGTFWQGTQPVSVAAAVDTSDRAAREAGRVRIWDGTDEATVVPLRTQPATSEKAIPIFDIPNRLATYAVTTAEIAPAITIGVKELLAVWAAAAGAKDKYIVEIWLTALVTTTSTTGGRTTARVSSITSAPTGGAELGKVDLGGAGASDMTNTMSVKTGGGTLGTTFIRREMWHALQAAGSRVSEALFQASNPGNGIILRAGSASGISIDCERAVAHTALVDQWTVSVRWLEV